jgi:multidrug efflux pump subunit AcrA (membrane-fusion protein)
MLISSRFDGLLTKTALALSLGITFGCADRPVKPVAEEKPAPEAAPTGTPRALRTQGVIAARRALSVQVPHISGQGGSLTLAKLVPNGSLVHEGDLLAEFDGASQLKAQRDAEAKFDDLSHQVEQKIAEGHSNLAKRSADLAQAQADLEKARLELRKGPVLSDLDQAKNREKADAAEAHVKSLNVSDKFHDEAEKTEVEVLVRQRERQKLTLARLQKDLEHMTVRAFINGMISLEYTFKNNSLGHAQEGDQLYPGSPLLRIFDPSSMVLQLSANEADGAALQPGSTATVYLDAYPGLKFPARFESASPVASAAVGSPLKTFSAIYSLDSKDPHLLPDLTAAADVLPPVPGALPEKAALHK